MPALYGNGGGGIVADGMEALSVKVVGVERDLTEHKADQAQRWADNRDTHKDLYQKLIDAKQELYAKLDRLPAWATLLIAVLASVATGAIVALQKR